MNSFFFSAITVCLAAQLALGQYANNNNYHQQQPQQYQRKMAPSPQTYGHQQAGYGSEMMSAYGNQDQESYRAPSSAAVSTYDERTPAASNYNQKSNSGYGKSSYGQQASSGYGQQAASGYGQQQAASGYGKAAPKYEEAYHAPMPFAWGYDINDGYGGAQYHKENGDEYGKRTGSYGYTDAYGIYRQVDYVADEHGFRATIKTNEPGTANESPADVEMHAYEPPSNFYAGNKDSGYSSGKSYAQQPQTSSYGAQNAQVVATYAPAANSGYGNQRNSYQQQNSYNNNNQHQMKSSGYQARASGYSAPSARSSGYGQQQQSSEQYSSSVVVPVYQKAAIGKPLAAVPAKRY